MASIKNDMCGTKRVRDLREVFVEVSSGKKQREMVPWTALKLEIRVVETANMADESLAPRFHDRGKGQDAPILRRKMQSVDA